VARSRGWPTTPAPAVGGPHHLELGAAAEIDPVDGPDRRVDHVGRTVRPEHRTGQIVGGPGGDHLGLDDRDAVVGVEAQHRLVDETRDPRIGEALASGDLELLVGVLEVPVGRLRLRLHQVAAVAVDLGQVGLGLLEGLLGGHLRVHHLALARPGEEPHRRAHDRDDREQAEHRERGPLAPFAADDHGRDPATPHGPLRHPVEQVVHATPQPAVGDDLGLMCPRLERGDAVAHVVGQRDRRALRDTREAVVGPNGLERRGPMRGGDLGRFHDDDAVPTRGAEAARSELPLDLVHGRLRVELSNRVLERPEPDPLGHVGRDQNQAVAHGDLAVPHLGTVYLVDRETAVRIGVGERQQAGLANEIRLRRAERGHVQLVAANDRQGDADRGRFTGVDDRSVGRVEQDLVRGVDGLAQADRDAGGEIVVVVVPDPFRDQTGGIPKLPPAAPGDEQIHAPLRTGGRADERLDHAADVGRVGEASLRGHEADVHL
jgi:hypothetical protein